MKKFHYSMESILKIKYRLEEQAKSEYMTAQNQYQEQIAILKEIETQKEQCENHLVNCMSGTLDVYEIQITKTGIIALRDAIVKQTRNVRVAENNMEAAREKLHQLMVERKTQEKLKEHAFEEYRREMAAEEGKEIDELVSFRFNNPTTE